MAKSRVATKKVVPEKRTLVSQVYNYLRAQILDFHLKPGDKIDVKQLSEELGVSQTPVREGLRMLVEQGLVMVDPYIGYFVVQLTAQDIKELFDLRSVLEALALRYAFNNLNEDQLRTYLDRLEEMKALTGEALAEATRRFDYDFHVQLILGNANTKWLAKYTNGILDLITLSTRLSLNPKAALEEHRKILQLLLKRDLQKSSEALVAHLQRAKRDALSLLNRPKEGDGDSAQGGGRS